jgi:hypothetical protein
MSNKTFERVIIESLMLYFIALAIVAAVVNNWLGFIQLDSIYFWKNTQKEAESVKLLTSKKKPIEIPQAEIYKKLHRPIENLNDLNELKRTKEQLLNKTVEWTIRTDNVQGYGNRYYITSVNESPVLNKAEEFGKKTARTIIGMFSSKLKMSGNTISMCGGSYVYAPDEQSSKVLNSLKYGDIIKIQGNIDGFTYNSSKYGFTKLGLMMQDEKTRESTTLCIQIDKAIISMN